MEDYTSQESTRETVEPENPILCPSSAMGLQWDMKQVSASSTLFPFLGN